MLLLYKVFGYSNGNRYDGKGRRTPATPPRVRLNPLFSEKNKAISKKEYIFIYFFFNDINNDLFMFLLAILSFIMVRAKISIRNEF